MKKINQKDKVAAILKDVFTFNAVIKKEIVNITQDMEKLLFVEIIKLLQEIDERNDVIGSLGLDLSEYDNLYYELIQNLLKLHFTDSQIEIINFFVYQLPVQETFDGKIEVKKGRKTVEIAFSTPEDLWQALQYLK
jgi:hypothetical protein